MYIMYVVSKIPVECVSCQAYVHVCVYECEMNTGEGKCGTT